MALNWKELLKINHKEVLGMDVGTTSVKMLGLLKENDEYIVTAAAKVDIAKSSKDSDHNKDLNIRNAIQQCYGASDISSRYAVCGVCGPEVAVRHFKFPVLPDEEIPSAVMLEAEQVCPFNVSDAVVDFQLVPNGQTEIKGVLVAATNKVAARKNRLIKESNLTPVLMDVDGLALLNCLTEYEKPSPEKAIAVLNIGGTYTTLAILGQDSLPFIRDTADAGNSIMQGIARENDVSINDVITSLFNDNEQSLHKEQADFTDSLIKASEKLIGDVNEALRYYTAQEKSNLVDKVLVCGGFSLARGFVELLDSRLLTEVSLWNPVEKMRCKEGLYSEELLKKNGPEMAVAAGLAMRSI